MSRASALAAAGAVAVACAGAPAEPAQAARPYAPTAKLAYTARPVIPTVARTRPGGGRVRWRVPTSGAWTGGDARLLVLRSAKDARGRLWLRVRLPIRPNTASGWVNANHVRLGRTAIRVVISTRRRNATVFRRGRVVRRFSLVVGAPGTPTPQGLFAVWEKALQPNPSDFLGPWALHLTAHSNVLSNYGGGPGRVAMHGRAGASLLDPLGTARSHGCIRIPNNDISWLARVAGPGTPVRVR